MRRWRARQRRGRCAWSKVKSCRLREWVFERGSRSGDPELQDRVVGKGGCGELDLVAYVVQGAGAPPFRAVIRPRLVEGVAVMKAHAAFAHGGRRHRLLVENGGRQL